MFDCSSTVNFQEPYFVSLRDKLKGAVVGGSDVEVCSYVLFVTEDFRQTLRLVCPFFLACNALWKDINPIFCILQSNR